MLDLDFDQVLSVLHGWLDQTVSVGVSVTVQPLQVAQIRGRSGVGSDIGFARLQSYAEREGDSRVPTSHRDSDGMKLGSWVGTQRQFRRRETLSDERARRLESLPVGSGRRAT